MFVTIGLSLSVIIVGSILGGALVSGLKSRVRLARVVCRAYVDVARAIPALVLIGTLYFCLPIVLNIRVTAVQSTFIALTLNLAPFVAECIRGGIESIPTSQYESACVMGFDGWRRTRYIIGPQVIRRVLPSLVGEYATTLKLTSLAATIGVPEIWHVTSQVITATSLPLEARIVGASLYVVITLPLLWISLVLEHKFNVRGLGPLGER